jgi:hypothetical protein
MEKAPPQADFFFDMFSHPSPLRVESKNPLLASAESERID